MGGSRGEEDRGFGSPLEKHKSIGFLINTGSDPLKNHKATRPAFNVGPSSARQGNGRTDDGPLNVVFGSSLPSTAKKIVKVHPRALTKLSGSAHKATALRQKKKNSSMPQKTYIFVIFHGCPDLMQTDWNYA